MDDCVIWQRAQHQATATSFLYLASHWATGVAVVTCADESDRAHGLTVSAVTSLSLTPMQFLICIDSRSRVLRAVLHSRRFGINFLRADQEELSKRFAIRIADRFHGIEHYRTESGVPVLTGSIGFVDCALSAEVPGGDHRILVGEAQQIIVWGGDPLVRFRGEYRSLR